MNAGEELRGWRAVQAFIGVRRRGPAALEAIAGRWGDVVSLRVGRRRFCLVSDPTAATHVLKQNARNYHKSAANRTVSEFLGTGLLTAQGETWQRHRKAAQGMFERTAMTCLEQSIRRHVSRTITALADVSPAGSVRLHDEMSRLAFRIICDSLFARDDAPFDEVRRQFQVATDFVVCRARQLVAPPRWLPTPSEVRFRRAAGWLGEFAATHVAALRAGERPEASLLKALLARAEDGAAGLSDRELCDEILTLILGGYETVGSSLAWALYLLSRHPDWLDRVRAETAAVDLPTKPFHTAPGCVVDQVFAETLRLYPPVWVLARQAVACDAVADRPVAAGTTMLVSPYVIHRDRRWWGDSETFRPDRFPLHVPFPPSFLPFGTGPRQCLGMSMAFLEARIVIPAFARCFDIEIDPAFTGKTDVSITLTPAQGMPVRLRRRSQP